MTLSISESIIIVTISTAKKANKCSHCIMWSKIWKLKEKRDTIMNNVWHIWIQYNCYRVVVAETAAADMGRTLTLFNQSHNAQYLFCCWVCKSTTRPTCWVRIIWKPWKTNEKNKIQIVLSLSLLTSSVAFSQAQHTYVIWNHHMQSKTISSLQSTATTWPQLKNTRLTISAYTQSDVLNPINRSRPTDQITVRLL